MINFRMICRIMGFLLYIEAGILAACSCFGFFFHEADMHAFLLSAGVTVLASGIFSFVGRKAERRLGRRDGYFIVVVAWVLFSLFGMLPFLMSGSVSNLTDAFFETMSGFTTTGATIFADVEVLPHGILFWRCLTQWIGGLGIVFFTIAVLPVFGVGGMKMFAAEATGTSYQKISPRIEVTARWIWSIYLLLTLAETGLLYMAGMDWFDSVCHALATTATGGFSTYNASVAAFHSPLIEYIIMLFMLLSGVNFSLLYFSLFRFNMKRLWRDTEVRYYLFLVVALGTFIGLGLFFTSPLDFEESLRESFFQVISVLTTTGFETADFRRWTQLLWACLPLVMFFGACSGSTSGGIKCIRLAIMVKATQNQFRRILHPNAVLPIRISGQVVSQNIRSAVLGFTFVYIFIVACAWFFFIAFGIHYRDSFGLVMCCISNVGAALGVDGPISDLGSISVVAKWLCSFLMLIGRLELFSVLLLFSPDFWNKR
ncbi:MAG: TrkH family potassium uptake protein [Bacteroidales bacterium]|nr:TrkH family potassium uptake protein [Bacteroidales bacterium]